MYGKYPMLTPALFFWKKILNNFFWKKFKLLVYLFVRVITKNLGKQFSRQHSVRGLNLRGLTP